MKIGWGTRILPAVFQAALTVGFGLAGQGASQAAETAATTPNAAPQASASASRPAPCDEAAPCALAEGRYMVKAPAHWDGKSPLAAVVWFHGHQQSSAEIMNDSDLDAQFSREGILMIVPDGRNASWSFPSGPKAENARDETAFIGDVIADVEKKYPIDPSRLFAAGFSIGATMVWTEACETPRRFSAYIAFSGDFWDPPPKSCAEGPVRLLQIHGTADPTFPIHGRPLRGGKYQQGDAEKGLDLWRQWKSCSAFALTPAPGDAMTATATGHCADGSSFAFWKHTRGHEVDPAWALAAIKWVKSEWNAPVRRAMVVSTPARAEH